MATLLQRPPLAMFDPSLIHRNDEIFNPKPNRLGIFFRLNSAGYSIPQRARWEQIVRSMIALSAPRTTVTGIQESRYVFVCREALVLAETPGVAAHHTANQERKKQ